MPRETDPARIIESILKKASRAAEGQARQTGAPQEQASARARADAEKRIREAAKPLRESAQKWTEEAIQVDSTAHAQAEEWARQNTYSAKSIEDAKGIFASRKALLEIGGYTVPKWIRTEEFQHSPQAAEFVSGVLLLPDDPYILYQEAAKAYWSMNWYEASREAAQELRQVLDQTLGHIHRDLLPHYPELASLANEDLMWMGIDRRGDLIRTIKPTPPPPAGELPKDDKEKFKEWKEERVREEQFRRLQELVALYQQDLEKPINDGLETQARLLKDLMKHLRDGRIREVPAAVKGLMVAKYNPQEAALYLDRAQARINTIASIIAERREAEYRIVKWDERLQQLYPDSPRRLGEKANLHLSKMTEREINDVLYGGHEKQREWIEEYRNRYIGHVGEAWRPDLEASIHFYEFIRLMEWMYGPDHPFVKYQLTLFSVYPDLDMVLKAIELRPVSQRPEDLYQAHRYISTKHHEILNQTPLIEIARPALLESVEAVMSSEQSAYFEAIEYLLEEEVFEGTPMSRVKIRRELEKRARATPGKPPHEEKLRLLREKFDTVGAGVILKDDHMLPNTAAYQRVTLAFEEYQRIQRELTQPDAEGLLSAAERNKLQSRQKELRREIKDQWEKYTLNPHNEFNPDSQFAAQRLAALRIFSPVELRAWDRIVARLRMDGAIRTEEDIYKMKWKIRESIWAARAVAVGTGELMEKSAKIGIGPLIDLKFRMGLTEEEIRESLKVKYFMNRSYAEAYQRVINPWLFADDFFMGGKMGDISRDLFYVEAFRRAGYKIEKDREWRQKLKDAQRKGVPQWVIYADYVHKLTGISYSEILRPDLLETGMMNLSTNWRNEEIIVDPIDEEFQRLRRERKLGPNASAEYQALGYRLAAVTASSEAETIRGREKYIRIMLNRKPSVFFKLIGKDLADILRGTGLHPGTRDWHVVQDALSIAEMELWRNEKFRWYEFNFANRIDFDKLMPRALRAAGVPESEISLWSDRCFNAIRRMRSYMEETASENGKSRISNWAKHNVKSLVILASTDFDWRKTDFSAVGVYQTPRRMNDFLGMFKARDIVYDILHKSEFLMPFPGKEVETLVKIKEGRDIVIGYTGQVAGENLAAALMAVVSETNCNRSIIPFWKHPRGLLAWIPGAVTLMRSARGIEHMVEYLKQNNEGFKHFLEEHQLLEVPLEKWPKSISEAVSYAVSFQGEEGNAWDEYRLAGFFAGAETLVMFPNFPVLLQELKVRFRTTLPWRLLYGVPRKYWWVVPVATVAVASMHLLQEEEKSRGGHS